MNKLNLMFTSKASMNQRKGRTGRTSEGICLRLMSKEFFDDIIVDYPKPELIRCQLEKVILQAKISKIGEIFDIFEDLIEKPNDRNLSHSFKTLIDLGALTVPSLNYPSGNVTKIGFLMSIFPCDVKLTKMIITGYTLGVVDEVIAIASYINIDRDLFFNSFEQ